MRVPVLLRHSYRLLNHGPTTLVSAAHEGRVNVMAAAWTMPLDFDPPKVCVVIAQGTLTRALVDGSRELTLSVPPRSLVDVTYAVGKVSGSALDKLATYGISTTPGSQVAAPLIDGCVAWLECKALPEAEIEGRYDLFVCEVVAAWADDRAFQNGEWRFTKDDDRTLHHVARGVFLMTGEPVEAKAVVHDEQGPG